MQGSFIRLRSKRSHVRVTAREAEALDVTEQITVGILRAQAAEVAADPEEGKSRLPRAPAVYGQSPHEHEAAPVQDLAEKG